MLSVTVPVKTTAGQEHLVRRQARAASQRGAAEILIVRVKAHLPARPLRVRIVRLAPRRYRLLADADLREALRHVQAGVSDALELPPDSADVTWFYDQERNRTYSVRVEFYADGETMQSAVITGATT